MNQLENFTGSIMIVDDTPANLDLIENMLDEKNYKVRPFTNGNFAIQSAEESPPDLILLDIMMPDIDGYEVCSKIKKNPLLKDIPIIFLSAKDETIDKVKAFITGGVDYITKPFQVEEVLARVEIHLRLHYYQKEIEKKNALLEKTLSNLKKTQSKLIHSEKMASLGVLTAGIAHEINNPVNSINSSSISLQKLFDKLKNPLEYYSAITKENYSELIEKIISQKDAVDFDYIATGIKELIQIIKNGAEKTTEIVENLRIFTRLDEKEKKEVNIHENLHSAIILLKNRIKDKIEIITEFSDVPKILCFPGELNQVFMNIITNSIDAIEAKSELSDEKITITTQVITIKNNEYLEITFKDTGVGIEKESYEKIYDPFYTTKDVGKGMGLGLAITYSIIEHHNAIIKFDSQPGKGTMFSLLIPYNP